MATAPAIISYYDHRHKYGKASVGHFVGGHPLRRGTFTFPRALQLAFVTGIVWTPFFAWMQVKRTLATEGMAFRLGVIILLVVLALGVFMGVATGEFLLGGFARPNQNQNQNQNQKGEKRSKEVKRA